MFCQIKSSDSGGSDLSPVARTSLRNVANENKSSEVVSLSGENCAPVESSFSCRSSEVHRIVTLFEYIYASGIPNLKGCRVPVNSKMNIPVWQKMVIDLHYASVEDVIWYCRSERVQ